MTGYDIRYRKLSASTWRNFNRINNIDFNTQYSILTLFHRYLNNYVPISSWISISFLSSASLSRSSSSRRRQQLSRVKPRRKVEARTTYRRCGPAQRSRCPGGDVSAVCARALVRCTPLASSARIRNRSAVRDAAACRSDRGRGTAADSCTSRSRPGCSVPVGQRKSRPPDVCNTHVHVYTRTKARRSYECACFT